MWLVGHREAIGWGIVGASGVLAFAWCRLPSFICVAGLLSQANHLLSISHLGRLGVLQAIGLLCPAEYFRKLTGVPFSLFLIVNVSDTRVGMVMT